MILDRSDDKGAYLKELSEGSDGKLRLSSEARSPFAEDYALKLASDGTVEYRYQLTDASETVASAAYFHKFGHQLPKELQKEAAVAIKTALDSYGLMIPEELEKTAAMDLGLTYERPELTLESLFSGSDVDIIGDAFDSCSPRGKRRLMLQVKEASALLGGNSYSEEGFGSDVRLAFDLRELRVSDEAKVELSGLLEKSASMEPEAVVRSLEAFDKKNQLCHLYGRFVPDPVESVYGQVVEKVASSVEAAVDINGEPVNEGDFTQFVDSNYDALQTSFGEDFASQLKSDPVTVYNSLPVTYKKAIESIYAKD